MNGTSNRKLKIALTAIFLACGAAPLAWSADYNISGVWQTHEGMPSGLIAGVTSSDIQTLYLSPDGTYRREIVVEGG